MSRRTTTQTVECDAAVEEVIALLADPRRIPEWAPAFADRVTGDARSGWRVTKDGRDFELRVVVRRDAGTVDYLRQVAPGRDGGAHIRAFARPGGGTVVVMTLPLPPDVDPTVIDATLSDELARLAELLLERP